MAAFALVAWVAFDDSRLQHLDALVLDDVSAHREGTLGDIAGAVVLLGDPVPQALLLLTGLGVAVYSGRWEAAIAGAILALGADLTTALLKHVLAEPRFDPILGWEQVDGNAFPSGHATAAFSMAAAWVLFVASRWWRLTALIGLLVACAVAASVVILRHHFPSDVLGGMLVAAAWFFAVQTGSRVVDRGLPRRFGASGRQTAA